MNKTIIALGMGSLMMVVGMSANAMAMDSDTGSELDSIPQVSASDDGQYVLTYDISVNKDGSEYRTLYTYGADSPGQPTCEGTCLENWPAAEVSPEDFAAINEGAPIPENFSIVEGSAAPQWAYNNSPLYTWINDAAPGQITGDNIGGFNTATPDSLG